MNILVRNHCKKKNRGERAEGELIKICSFLFVLLLRVEGAGRVNSPLLGCFVQHREAYGEPELV